MTQSTCVDGKKIDREINQSRAIFEIHGHMDVENIDGSDKGKIIILLLWSKV